MNDLLKEKLTNLLSELQANHKEIVGTFLEYKGKKDAKGLLDDYKKEKIILEKYGCNMVEIIDYSVKLNFAIRDLIFILKYK